jgi:hypothetical protein
MIRVPAVTLLMAARIGLAGPACPEASVPMVVPKSEDRAARGVWATPLEELMTCLQQAHERRATDRRPRAAATVWTGAAALVRKGRVITCPVGLEDLTE